MRSSPSVQLAMSHELPESNNVYSVIASPVELKLSKQLLAEEFPDAKVWIKNGYKGAKTLHLSSETADFKGYPEHDVGKSDYLFTGALAGNNAEIICRVTSIFQRFNKAGLQLSIEAYSSNGELLCDFPGKTDAQE